jgi:predicted nucleic acid-binding protein
MAVSSSGLLLDSSVVIRDFRGGQELLGALGSFELFYLPYVALAELYSGAYRSLRSDRNLQQISSFLDAVDVLLPDEETHLSTDALRLSWRRKERPSRKMIFG